MVWELLHKNIIPRGVQERISRTDEPKQQNEILHDCLQRTCTKEALTEVCDIIVAVRGHPKMRELGEAMKRRLHTGVCEGGDSVPLTHSKPYKDAEWFLGGHLLEFNGLYKFDLILHSFILYPAPVPR